jgi:protein TonB
MIAARRLMLAVSVLAFLGPSSWPGSHAASVRFSAPSQLSGITPLPPKVEVAGKDGVTRPRVVRQVAWQYTSEARRRNIQGVVDVECTVLTDGTVSSARILFSLDDVYGLDNEALKAVRQWRFEPATKNGVPVPATMTISLGFKIEGVAPEPAPLTWPETFPPDGKATSDVSEWQKATLDAANLRATFAYPAVACAAPALLLGLAALASVAATRGAIATPDSVPRACRTTAPPASPSPTAGAEEVVRALYRRVSFDAGRKVNWDDVKAIFIPEAVIVLRSSRTKMTVYNPDGFVREFVRFVTESKLEDRAFEESTVAVKTQEIGDIARSIVHYAARIPSEPRRVEQGIDVFLLMKKDDAWRIVSLVNQVVRPGVPVPEELRK